MKPLRIFKPCCIFDENAKTLSASCGVSGAGVGATAGAHISLASNDMPNAFIAASLTMASPETLSEVGGVRCGSSFSIPKES